MNGLIKIENQELQIKEYQGHRVVTFKDIDKVHERVKGTAKRNFNENKHHLIEGVDYFFISRNDVGMNFVPTYGFDNRAPSGAVITESGYLMIVKSLTDDLAWKVQRQLVNSYFRVKKEVSDNTSPSITFEQMMNVVREVRKTPQRSMSDVFRILKVFIPELEMPPVEEQHKHLQGAKVVKDDMEFQKLLNNYLQENNLSICEFVRQSGFPKSNVSNWVNGRCTPSMTNLQKLSDVIDVDINIFLES